MSQEEATSRTHGYAHKWNRKMPLTVEDLQEGRTKEKDIEEWNKRAMANSDDTEDEAAQPASVDLKEGDDVDDDHRRREAGGNRLSLFQSDFEGMIEQATIRMDENNDADHDPRLGGNRLPSLQHAKSNGCILDRYRPQETITPKLTNTAKTTPTVDASSMESNIEKQRRLVILFDIASSSMEKRSFQERKMALLEAMLKLVRRNPELDSSVYELYTFGAGRRLPCKEASTFTSLNSLLQYLDTMEAVCDDSVITDNMFLESFIHLLMDRPKEHLADFVLFCSADKDSFDKAFHRLQTECVELTPHPSTMPPIMTISLQQTRASSVPVSAHNCQMFAYHGVLKRSLPWRLHDMLDDVDRLGKDWLSVVGWSREGTCFRIHKERQFEEHILPIYFEGTLRDFANELKCWKFTSTRDFHGNEFIEHPWFIKSARELRRYMVFQSQDMTPRMPNQNEEHKQATGVAMAAGNDDVARDMTSRRANQNEPQMRTAGIAMAAGNNAPARDMKRRMTGQNKQRTKASTTMAATSRDRAPKKKIMSRAAQDFPKHP